MKVCNQEEPILRENPDRFCMFPIKYRAVWEMYKKAEASFWTGEPLQQAVMSCRCKAQHKRSLPCRAAQMLQTAALHSRGPPGACTGHSTLFGLAHHADCVTCLPQVTDVLLTLLSMLCS